ncbi:uncharacterized protein L969DRAFT_95286 [Mixia osmundae IAM 14324]|uniref:Uncharacterized protein n=1 Tax=Mixia osmundae (strain CBS 9802 / IAM 14324 / JCM 22182 / KY 12970) TaxID=764103 RepID=G7E6L6_MIXOS|nr:uncharacterized protein L969DRAFT_95286 [Mixia osmundae IAM 14324]KEI39146.1 hypothetical protein L969DRAFT_95286 [Mixia osmundae IAM 14324]GAA98476.1 hypothetical protein E5Q_05162 [Mixia osmundae IAM 14324]
MSVWLSPQFARFYGGAVAQGSVVDLRVLSVADGEACTLSRLMPFERNVASSSVDEVTAAAAASNAPSSTVTVTVTVTTITVPGSSLDRRPWTSDQQLDQLEQQGYFKDRHHERGLYYIRWPPNHARATERPILLVSYVPQPPTDLSDPTLLGSLDYPPELKPSADRAHDDTPLDQLRIAPGSFHDNPDFINVVHAIVSGAIYEDEVMKVRAEMAAEGWLHLLDERNPPPLNRAGEPDDIIATTLVQQGKLVRESYEPMPSYRVHTRDGFLTLPESLHKSVLHGIRVARSIIADAKTDSG